MTSPASVAGGDHVRLFCALRLPDHVLDALVEWQRGLAGGRVVPRDNLHVTLAFLGRQPRERVGEVVESLRRRVAELAPPLFRVERYRETRSVGMLVLSRDEGAERLALGLQADLLGAPERETWLPHVTVLRFKERPRLRPELPDLGEIVPSDAAAYLSVLRPGGAQYHVLESVPLGGV